MKKIVKEKLAMYGVVGQLVGSNESSWESIPAFAGKFSNYLEKLNELKTIATSQIQIVKGNAAQKQLKKHALVKDARTLVSALIVVAKDSDNAHLMEQLPVQTKKLEYAGQAVLFASLETIISQAQVHQNQLGELGISASFIGDLIAKRDEYLQIVFGPRQAIAIRKQLTKQLDELIDELDDMLKYGLDQMMKMVGQTDPNLYDKYKNVRNLINLPTHTKHPNDADSSPDSELSFDA